MFSRGRETVDTAKVCKCKVLAFTNFHQSLAGHAGIHCSIEAMSSRHGITRHREIELAASSGVQSWARKSGGHTHVSEKGDGLLPTL